MIVTKLTGSIGSQMFQYAVGRNFSIINNCELMVDASELAKNMKSTPDLKRFVMFRFNTNFNIAGSAIINNFLRTKSPSYLLRFPFYKNYKLLKDTRSNFLNELYFQKPPYLLLGNFHNENYFIESFNQVKNDFIIKDDFIEVIATLVNELENTNSVAIYLPCKLSDRNEIDIVYYKKETY